VHRLHIVWKGFTGSREIECRMASVYPHPAGAAEPALVVHYVGKPPESIPLSEVHCITLLPSEGRSE
jgi:hypothetical protein